MRQVPSRLSITNVQTTPNIERHPNPQRLFGRPAKLHQGAGADFPRSQRPPAVRVLGRDPHVVQVPIRFQDEVTAEVGPRAIADRFVAKRHRPQRDVHLRLGACGFGTGKA